MVAAISTDCRGQAKLLISIHPKKKNLSKRRGLRKNSFRKSFPQEHVGACQDLQVEPKASSQCQSFWFLSEILAESFQDTQPF